MISIHIPIYCIQMIAVHFTHFNIVHPLINTREVIGTEGVQNSYVDTE